MGYTIEDYLDDLYKMKHPDLHEELQPNSEWDKEKSEEAASYIGVDNPSSY